MTVADAIAEFFDRKGCTHAFGIVGGGNVTMFDAIAKRLHLVCVHHEQAAAMAATYYFRTCGRIAPVLVTSGAGSANAITGVMAAYMDSVPLVVLAGNEKADTMAGRTRILGVQGYESAKLAQGFTKGALTWLSARSLDSLEHYYALALEPRQGPVWLNIPMDIQRMSVPEALRAVA